MKRLIFATGNENKMKEIREIMEGLPVEILSMKEAGIEADIVEDGMSFEENALIKARAVCRLAGEMVLADDSGLEVDHLNKVFTLHAIWERIPLTRLRTRISLIVWRGCRMKNVRPDSYVPLRLYFRMAGSW